ncbi:MAG: hypothetical protein K6A36_06080 [Paludibacteraceae bacterium]|nr:hypothetical protein [Paludibacteraceae bacterium]
MIIRIVRAYRDTMYARCATRVGQNDIESGQIGRRLDKLAEKEVENQVGTGFDRIWV